MTSTVENTVENTVERTSPAVLADGETASPAAGAGTEAAGTAATNRVLANRRSRKRRELLVGSAIAVVALIVFTLALTLGDFPVSPSQLIGSLLSPITGSANPGIDFIVLELRLPRAIAALLVGAAFGIAGIVFQSILRNPLASPDVIGISAGASAAAVYAIVLLGWSGILVSFSAFAGAAVAAIAIAAFAWRKGLDGYRIVLVGIGVAAILNAVVSYVLTRGTITEAQQALTWLVGSFNGSSFESQVVPLAIALAVLLPLVLVLGPDLKNLQLGDDAARALGTRAELSRVVLLGAAVVLAAFAAATVGPLAFVAFLAGPIARRILGTASLGVIPTALIGAIITIGADLVAQYLFPVQLPAGVVTGAVGAPYLLWLLATSSRAKKGRS